MRSPSVQFARRANSAEPDVIEVAVQQGAGAGRPGKRAPARHRHPTGGHRGAADVEDERVGRVGADRGVDDAQRLEVLEHAGGGASDPVIGLNVEVVRDLDVLKKFSSVRVNVSIPTDSEELRKIFEPKAPPT